MTTDEQIMFDAAILLNESQRQVIFEYQAKFARVNDRYKEAVDRIRELEDALQAHEVAA